MDRKHHVKPLVLISKCLEGDNCRYNGEIISDPFIRSLKSFISVRYVCPEVEAGLGIPRPPVRVIIENGQKKLYQPATGKDITIQMTRFSEKFVRALPDVDGCILKYRSPSCGLTNVKIYKSKQKNAPAEKGNGIFAEVLQKNLPGIPLEDEGRLQNFTLREHFLISLFTLARFRYIKEQGQVRDLVHFHATHKYLFMAYSQKVLKILGKITANHNHAPPEKLYTEYQSCLGQVFSKPVRYTAMINVLEHMFGYFSSMLTGEEKNFFLNTLEEYRDERIPLSVCLNIINAWSIRFNETYLLDQVILEPFPRQLVKISDSGKGRKY